ncbi:MAG: shikimate dehydrogenase [Clostridia bacterium]|nr:shikimate dehydrogenase [Clostridia bacterium]
MTYGCIGEHLSHSFSKEIHNRIETYEYTIREVPKEELDAFMTAREFTAINVTIPYKQDVIPYLHEISDIARSIGAVNTIVNRDGKLYGYNTDFFGMKSCITRAGISLAGKKVLILGTGGTSRTARAVAEAMDAGEIIVVSRTEKPGVITYEQASRQHWDAGVILNTTPVGMYPNPGVSPVDINCFPNLSGVFDAIYNPLASRLIMDAREKGIPAEGGLYMLVAQAVFAAEKFTGKTYEPEIIEETYREIFLSKQNIVLTGMPASGKTTVGRLLAEETGRTFVDTDVEIVKKYGMEIPEIFEKFGEAGFRERERDVVAEVGKNSALVIATGGGAILRDDNMDALRQNGKIYFLDRPLDKLLPTADRPTANSADAIRRRYAERYGRYCGTADVIVPMNEDPEINAEKILSLHR